MFYSLEVPHTSLSLVLEVCNLYFPIIRGGIPKMWRPMEAIEASMACLLHQVQLALPFRLGRNSLCGLHLEVSQASMRFVLKMTLSLRLSFTRDS